MKRGHKIALGLITVSWLATGAAWLAQKSEQDRQASSAQQGQTFERGGHGSSRNWKVAPDSITAAAQAVVTAQLQAFKRDDYLAASRLQSQSLQKNFPSSAAFRAMLRQNYPQFSNFKSLQFDNTRYDPASRRVATRIRIIASDGVATRALYLLVREGKNYKIDGVIGGQVVRDPQPHNGSQPGKAQRDDGKTRGHLRQQPAPQHSVPPKTVGA